MGKLVLWILPRTKSTAICKALSNNAEIKCLFQPYTLGKRRSNGERVHQKVIDQFSQEDHVFFKDTGMYLSPEELEYWIQNEEVNHILLIRSPEKIALSMFRVDGELAPYFIQSELIKIKPLDHYFANLKTVRDRLKRQGRSFLVLDSENLSPENNGKFLRSICEFGSLPFDKEMLELTPSDGKLLPSNWWVPDDSRSASQKVNGVQVDMFEDALGSTELGNRRNVKYGRSDLGLNEIKQLDELIARCQPIYEDLKNG